MSQDPNSRVDNAIAGVVDSGGMRVVGFLVGLSNDANNAFRCLYTVLTLPPVVFDGEHMLPNTYCKISVMQLNPMMCVRGFCRFCNNGAALARSSGFFTSVSFLLSTVVDDTWRGVAVTIGYRHRGRQEYRR